MRSILSPIVYPTTIEQYNDIIRNRKMKILITSGGTKIKIDGVRSITNMSRGTFGSAICKSFLEKGHEVDFLMAEDSKTPFKYVVDFIETTNGDFDEFVDFAKKNKDSYNQYTYKTFDDYKEKIELLMANNKYDIIVLAAAVSDYGVKNVVNGKIRSSGDLNIELVPLPKIIKEVKNMQPDAFLVGFKLLVDTTDKALIFEAKSSIEKNGCDLVVANDLSDIKKANHRLLVLEKNSETCTVFTKDESESYGGTLADSLTTRILDVIAVKKILTNSNKNV